MRLTAGTGGDVLGSAFSPQARDYIKERLAGLQVEMRLDERLVAHEVNSHRGMYDWLYPFFPFQKSVIQPL